MHVFAKILALVIFVFVPSFVCAAGNAEQFVPAELPINIIGEDYATAKVLTVYREVRNTIAGYDHLMQKLHLRILSGPDAGQEFDADHGMLHDQQSLKLGPGDIVTLQTLRQSDGVVRRIIRDPYRLPAIGWLIVIFAFLCVLFGGIRGLTSIVGLFTSVAILFFFVVPFIAAGYDPLVVSIMGSYAIAFTSLYLAHGFSKRTSVALLSTCITLALAVIAAVLSVYATNLLGMGSEESMYLVTGQFSGINLRGLLIGGCIIGALGVLDDITTAQTAGIHELTKANPSMTFAELYAAGMSIGREHIASLINTLALAYVGASLPLMLLFRQDGNLPMWVVLNGEFIAQEIVRTLIGSTALLLAVPISTWCAVYFLRNRTGRTLPASCGHIHIH